MGNQTAVAFLIEEINARKLWTKELRLASEQALQIEREQLEETWDESVRQSANKGGMHAASITTLLNKSNSENHPKKKYFNQIFKP